MADFIPKIEYGTGPTTIEFDVPPIDDPLRERVVSNQRTLKSNNGTTQTQFNYNEEILNPRFRGLSKALADALRTFFKDHGGQGKSFSYFEDKDSASFRTVTLDSFNIRPVRDIPQGTGSDFKYRIELRMRRTL